MRSRAYKIGFWNWCFGFRVNTKGFSAAPQIKGVSIRDHIVAIMGVIKLDTWSLDPKP